MNCQTLKLKKKKSCFLYLKKIGAIQDYKIKNEILILKIKSKKLYFYEFAEIASITNRFEFKNRDQLSVFINKNTKKNFKKYLWADDNPRNLKNSKILKESVELILKPICFPTQKDRELFFNKLKNIPSIISYMKMFNYIDIVVKSYCITDEDLNKVKQLFDEYSFENKEQLKVFVNKKQDSPFYKELQSKVKPKNKSTIQYPFQNSKEYWENDFCQDHLDCKNDIQTITIKPFWFNTRDDKYMFFDWLESISCVLDFRGQLNHINVAIESKEISKEDYENLKAIFERYKFQNIDQLDIFIDKDTKKPFDN